MRLFLKCVLGAVVIYGALLAGSFAAMRQPPYVFGRIMSRVPDAAFLLLPFRSMWLVARRGHLQVGDPAPGFSLETVDCKSQVQLSRFRGQKPVVLIFGSHT